MRAPSLVGPVPVIALVLLTAVPVAAQRARSGQLYELVPLEAGSFTRATDVNKRGQACGLVTEVSGTQAYRWSTAAGVVPLAPAVYSSAMAIGINGDGFVLGTSFSPSQSAATVWSPAGTPLALPDLGWSMSDPAAISDAGVVVGRGS